MVSFSQNTRDLKMLFTLKSFPNSGLPFSHNTRGFLIKKEGGINSLFLWSKLPDAKRQNWSQKIFFLCIFLAPSFHQQALQWVVSVALASVGTTRDQGTVRIVVFAVTTFYDMKNTILLLFQNGIVWTFGMLVTNLLQQLFYTVFENYDYFWGSLKFWAIIVLFNSRS